MLVDDRKRIGVAIAKRRALEAMFEDRLDMTVGLGGSAHRASARGLEPLGAVPLGEPQDAEPRSVSLLRMRA